MAAGAALQLQIRVRRPPSSAPSRPPGGRWIISFGAEGGGETGTPQPRRSVLWQGVRLAGCGDHAGESGSRAAAARARG